MKIGVCYYPEHWPEARWEEDARLMHAHGIRIVRIGEFAWQQLEPTDGDYRFDWLIRAMDTLHRYGLGIVLGTPTATPPKWLLDKFPQMLAIDETGRERGYGSRRHYCFSSLDYRRECARIVGLIAQKLGNHPGLVAWQTDNEYGCHNTSISYSQDALRGFRSWCEERYQSIDELNRLWGNDFWSMNYASFGEIELPALAVTETNPAHQLAFWRYSSAQVRAFNRLQTELIRTSSALPVSHNFMGNFVEFDHREVAMDLDIATWDSYPLGFLDRDGATSLASPHSSDAGDDPGSAISAWYRTGHPDTAAFHHDLYRGLCNGRWWVMEQQPGPVNWAPHNPSPLPGMVRLWGLEAFAHGAEVVSYFRWRQLPTAQEQMHTGLLRPDGSHDVALDEVRQLGHDIDIIRQQFGSGSVPTESALQPLNTEVDAAVALVFDYPGDSALRIQRPGGISGLHGEVGGRFDPLGWSQSIYSALRECGQDVDMVGCDTDLTPYSLVIVACAGIENATLVERLSETGAHILMLPRSGSKTAESGIPETLPPGLLQALIPLKVVRSESLPAEVSLPAVVAGGRNNQVTLNCCDWREHIESELAPVSSFDDGWGFHYRHERDGQQVHYLNAWLEQDSLKTFLTGVLQEAGMPAVDCPPGLRLSTLSSSQGHDTNKVDVAGADNSPVTIRFACHYGPGTVDLLKIEGLAEADKNAIQRNMLVGSRELNPADVAVWTLR